MALIEDGYDPERIILPVLREKAATVPDIPRLRTWRYFIEPIKARTAGMQSRQHFGNAASGNNRPSSNANSSKHKSGMAGIDLEAATHRVLVGSVKGFGPKSKGGTGR